METEGKKALFDWRISMGNVLVVVGMLVSGFLYFADIDKTNALQDVQIAAEQQARKEAILAEQQARREALQDLRIRIDADRAEMRAQFEKINDKLDALVKSRGQ
ncbi:MAG: hypothetical protein ACFNT5_04945 [Cardiobacterium hominis]|jgi:hypothetical protein|uniref:Uncharacterized protein n=1 Tax=Siphoviridae sp. ctMBu2 TaxID=2827853 RepID=A0A8S5T4I9_9CAUD|nr:MAG TPA: hypothetical protein [Siphoviridae sp. ctMBu2]DAX93805.1 MAG TPA: hypothetical protein [Caudoviricetes sp.]